MLNTLFDHDDFYYNHGTHPYASRLAQMRQEEQRRRAEIAYRRRMEEEARRRRAAEAEYRRRLARKREMMERLRPHDMMYSPSLGREWMKGGNALGRWEEERRRGTEAPFMGVQENSEPIEEALGSESYETSEEIHNAPDRTEGPDCDMEELDSMQIEKEDALNTVVVEDASDSECEDELLSSPWRNRRPSPGQWMEPIPQ